MGVNPLEVMCPTSFICDTYKMGIIKLDELLSNMDKEYNSEECTYKGKEEYSLAKYIEEKFEVEISEMDYLQWRC